MVTNIFRSGAYPWTLSIALSFSDGARVVLAVPTLAFRDLFEHLNPKRKRKLTADHPIFKHLAPVSVLSPRKGDRALCSSDTRRCRCVFWISRELDGPQGAQQCRVGPASGTALFYTLGRAWYSCWIIWGNVCLVAVMKNLGTSCTGSKSLECVSRGCCICPSTR